jgi:TetR/AcrR family transcriptional repressor of nem operon
MQQMIKSHADALIEAGLRLSRRVPLSRVTTAVIATEAGLPSLRFFDAYPDLTHYLIDLYQQHFLLPVQQQIGGVLARVPAGKERLRAIAQGYLDFCLKNRGLRRWGIEARALSEFETLYNRSSQAFQLMANNELKPLGFSDNLAAARFCSAMIYEVSLVETQEGHEHAGLRQCLWRLLEFSERPILNFATRPPTPASPAVALETPRLRLLRAGEVLLKQRRGDLSTLELDILLAQADADRASFDACFGDISTFHVALIQLWAEGFMTRCLAASQGLPPGTERLHAFMAASWDHQHESRDYRLLMKSLLATNSEVRSRIRARIQSYTRMVAQEYQALGVASPQAMARLFIACSNELVEAEEAGNVVLPRLRETFWQMFDPLTAGTRARRGRRKLEPMEAGQSSFLSLPIGEVPARPRRKRLSREVLMALRQRLLEAGDRLLLSGDAVIDISPNRLALLAGVEPEELTACYPDFNVYLIELLTFLLDEARDLAVEATAHMPTGLARVRRGIEVYLDARLDRPAIHELSRLLQGYPAAAKLSRGRSRGFAHVILIELRALGWKDPQENAHLIVALTSETVQAECEAGRRLPEYRSTLHAFLSRS